MSENVLTKEKVGEYVKSAGIFRDNALEITDVLSEIDETEGLVNQIYRIRDTVTDDSLVIKQVLPYALAISREVGEYHYMNPERILSESRALAFLETFWEGIAPVLYRVDRGENLLIMEDLTDYKNLRFELPKGKMYPYFGVEIGTLLAGLRYYTSRLYLDEKSSENLEAYFLNAYHRERMADMIMGEDNITKHPEKFDASVRELCESIGNNKRIQEGIVGLRDTLVYHPNCFCHMDLHIGNILVRDESIKLIDSEFSGYGTSYMDLGRIASSFLINFFSWLGREDVKGLRDKMLEYDIQIIYNLFTSYRMTLENLTPKEAEKIYLEEEKNSIKLMMLSTLLRMQSGIALSFDMSLLSQSALANVEETAFKLLRDVFTDESLCNLEAVIHRLEELIEEK